MKLRSRPRRTLQHLRVPVITVLIVLSIVLGFARFIVVPFSDPRPADIGVINGGLHPCDAHVNCISGEITYTGGINEARDRLLAVIESLPRATIITEEPHYIYVEFRSRIWGFVDDVEFYFPHFTPTMRYRSLSRLGRDNLDDNRDRMQTIIDAVLAGE